MAVGDPVGARLNAAVRQLLVAASEENGPSPWDDLVGAAKALRWRQVTQPQVLGLNPALYDGVNHVTHQAELLRRAVRNDALLDELCAAVAELATLDPVLGGLLLRSILETGSSDCVVVAANQSARFGIENWLGAHGVRVVTAAELGRHPPIVSQTYVVGPPRFFGSGLVTAPVTSEVSFFMPAWFADRRIPRSAIEHHAEGAIRVDARVVTEGDLTEPPYAIVHVEDDLLPTWSWSALATSHRSVAADEVEAHKVLLSNNLAIWLDDGDRIRALDPSQPVGERVVYVEVDAVRPGTYLLLRRGETERSALYTAALALLGADSVNVDATQCTWKAELAVRLLSLGRHEVVRRLKDETIGTAERARAWTDPNLIRPQRDHDFHRLLQWLGIADEPTISNANRLRRNVYQASADIRERLEVAVSATDLSLLERDGHLSLDLDSHGFRGILAARVLAISPHTTFVARHEARLPFEDWSSQWLE